MRYSTIFYSTTFNSTILACLGVLHIFKLWNETLPSRTTHCNTLQHTATHCNTLQQRRILFQKRPLRCTFSCYQILFLLQCVAVCCSWRYHHRHCLEGRGGIENWQWVSHGCGGYMSDLAHTVKTRVLTCWSKRRGLWVSHGCGGYMSDLALWDGSPTPMALGGVGARASPPHANSPW